MNRFCTLFDSFYLTRGLALYESLRRSGTSFRLAVYCFDDVAAQTLERLKLPEIDVVRLPDFETPALLQIKPSRTRGEYCWTCTPHVIQDALDRFSLQEVTYLDADLCFFASPDLLLQEFRASGASVLLTEHRYESRHDQSATSGTYCVQFMTFRNTEAGSKALRWWGDRCLEWCYARTEDGKFGDQKYLDDWLTRFEGVHVLQHLGGGVAPWNVGSYRVEAGPQVDGVPVVFYHFHNLEWLTSGLIAPTGNAYPIRPETVHLIYRPYIELLKASLEVVRQIEPKFDRGFKTRSPGILTLARKMRQKLKGTYREIRA
jgi:hypothetical protein